MNAACGLAIKSTSTPINVNSGWVDSIDIDLAITQPSQPGFHGQGRIDGMDAVETGVLFAHSNPVIF